MVNMVIVLNEAKLRVIIALLHNSNIFTYRCIQCPQTFGWKSNLDLHMRVHNSTNAIRIKYFPDRSAHSESHQGANDQYNIRSDNTDFVENVELPYHASKETQAELKDLRFDISEVQLYPMLDWNDVDTKSHLQFLEVAVSVT